MPKIQNVKTYTHTKTHKQKAEGTKKVQTKDYNR